MGYIGKKTGLAILVVILAVSVNHYRSQKVLSPVLATKNGKIQGIESFTRGGKKIYEFRRIPFAKVPVGQLRFEPPQPAEPWSGILDATQSGPQCMQVNSVTGGIEGSEDCLYLNVYIPAAANKKDLPVMVWIHGGAFTSGSANLYNPAYLLDENVILVTTNYRLAALGFLNTGDGVIRGNQGLKDQNMALRWVKENIKYFGGDPTQVTLFGESAGSMSVGFHLLSPLSKGLFSRAIMQSGSPTGKWAINSEPAKQAKLFAEKFGCPVTDTKKLVNCLKEVDSKTLVEAHRDTLPLLKEKITLFVPSIEAVQDGNTFIGEDPSKSLRTGKINKVPLIAGLNEHEGLLVSSVIVANRTNLQLANDDWLNFAALTLAYDPMHIKESEQIRQFYFPQAKNIASAEFLEGYTNMMSDRKFFIPVHQFVKEYLKHAPVRMYWYSYSAEFSLGDILAASQSDRLPALVSVIWDILKRYLSRTILGQEIPHLGVCHADELQLLFNWQMSSYISKEHKDYAVSKKMAKLWGDFANNREPLTVDNIGWPTLKESQAALQYLNISIDPKMIQEPFTSRVQFWERLAV